jgi:cell division protease FtsH
MVFLGREISEQRDYSDAVAEKIDEEVRQLIDIEYRRTRRVLEENRDILELVATTLLDVETLEGDELIALIEGTDAPTPTPEDKPSPEQPKKVAGERTEWEAPSTLDLPPAPSPA